MSEPEGARAPLVRLRDLDQVSARVVEDGGRHRTHLERLLGELHPEGSQPVELRADVVHGERRERDAVVYERLLERLGSGVAVRLEEELRAVRLLAGRDGEPLRLTERDLRLLLEAEDAGVEVERLVLIVDEDAGEVDSHVSPLHLAPATDPRSARA